jgi:putative membrane protein
MSLFTLDEEKAVGRAIAAAERKTSGEILAVVAAQSDSYFYIPFLVASLVALLVPWPFIYLTWHPVQWIYLIQLVVFGAIVVLLLPMSNRLWFVPAGVKRQHAHRRAREQFIAQNLHTSAGRTGVMIFVSLAERYAEIIADNGIHKKVPADTWQHIVDRLTADLAKGKAADGFITAINACGVLLAKHVPPGTENPDELPNHLIVLS